jgi:hypothetical protein
MKQRKGTRHIVQTREKEARWETAWPLRETPRNHVPTARKTVRGGASTAVPWRDPRDEEPETSREEPNGKPAAFVLSQRTESRTGGAVSSLRERETGPRTARLRANDVGIRKAAATQKLVRVKREP